MTRKRKPAVPTRRPSCARCRGSGLIQAKAYFQNRATGVHELVDCMAQCPECIVRPDEAKAVPRVDQAQRAAGEG